MAEQQLGRHDSFPWLYHSCCRAIGVLTARSGGTHPGHTTAPPARAVAQRQQPLPTRLKEQLQRI